MSHRDKPRASSALRSHDEVNHHFGITNVKDTTYAQEQLRFARRRFANRSSRIHYTINAIADGRLRFGGKSASLNGSGLGLFRAALARMDSHMSRDEAQSDSISGDHRII
jgi:hypothetical protein